MLLNKQNRRSEWGAGRTNESFADVFIHVFVEGLKLGFGEVVDGAKYGFGAFFAGMEWSRSSRCGGSLLASASEKTSARSRYNSGRIGSGALWIR